MKRRARAVDLFPTRNGPVYMTKAAAATPAPAVDPAEQEEPQYEGPQHGKFVFPDGAVYEGEFQLIQNVRVRSGSGVYRDGKEQYSGEWKDDQMHGKGRSIQIFKHSINDHFGVGIYDFASGAKYEVHSIRTWSYIDREIK